MKIHFIKSSQKRKILSTLKEEYGISEIPYLLIESGKEKIRGYTGSLSKDEILDLGKLTRIESLGLYVFKNEKGNFRPTADFLHLNKNQIKNKIVNLTEEQADDWLHGHDLTIEAEKGIVCLQFEELFLGSGVSNGSVIYNYLPKERRIRN